MAKFTVKNINTGEEIQKGTNIKSSTKESREEDPEVKANSSLPEISVDLENLPSRGLPYPEAKITYRPYTYGELIHLAQSSKGKANTNNDIIDSIQYTLNGIYVANIEKEDLTLSDYNYISVLRKISTIGQGDLFLSWKCPECGYQNKTEFTLFDLEFVNLTQKGFIAELSGREVDFVPLTVRNYIKFLRNKATTLDKDIALLALQVKNMKFEEAYQFLYNLTGINIEILKEVDNLLYHDVKDIEVKCQKGDCGFTSKLPFQVIDKFLVADQGHRGSVKAKIRPIE